RPDPVTIEPARDPGAERQRVAVVDEHHRFAQQRLNRPVLDEQLEDKQQAEHHAEREAEAVEPRPLTLPDEQRGSFADAEANQIDDHQEVRDEEPDAEEKEDSLEELLQRQDRKSTRLNSSHDQ